MHKAIKFIVHILSMTSSLLYHDSGWLMLDMIWWSQPIDVNKKYHPLHCARHHKTRPRSKACLKCTLIQTLCNCMKFSPFLSSPHLIYAPRQTYSILVNSISQVCNQACRAAECWTLQIAPAWIAATMQGTGYSMGSTLTLQCGLHANIVLSCPTALT